MDADGATIGSSLDAGVEDRELRSLVRRAGILYALVALIAPLGLLVVPARLVDPGDAAATASNLVAHPGLLRLGIASEAVNQIVEVFLVLALYRVFQRVHGPLARQMLVLGLLPIPLVMLNMAGELVAVSLAPHPGWAGAFDASQLDALVLLLMRLHAAGLAVAELFWGLWLVPLGLLIRRCGFLPAWLGGLVIVAGAGYLTHASLVVVAPGLAAQVSVACALLEMGELAMVLWLVFVGARPARPSAQ